MDVKSRKSAQLLSIGESLMKHILKKRTSIPWRSSLVASLLLCIYLGYPWLMFKIQMMEYHAFLRTPSSDQNMQNTKYVLMRNQLYQLKRTQPNIKNSVHLVQICSRLQDFQCVHDEIIELTKQRVSIKDQYLFLAKARYHLDQERFTPAVEQATSLCVQHQVDPIPCQVLKARALQNSENWDGAIELWQSIIANTDVHDEKLAIRQRALDLAIEKKKHS